MTIVKGTVNEDQFGQHANFHSYMLSGNTVHAEQRYGNIFCKCLVMFYMRVCYVWMVDICV